MYQPAMEEVRSGKRAWVKLDDLHRESLGKLAVEFGLKGVSAGDLDDLNRAWHRLDPWPDAVPGLTRLKRKYVLATLSNGNVALMVNMAKRAGLPWDAILGAEVTRYYKPQPGCYLGHGGNARASSRPSARWSPRTTTTSPRPGAGLQDHASSRAPPSTAPARPRT